MAGGQEDRDRVFPERDSRCRGLAASKHMAKCPVRCGYHVIAHREAACAVQTTAQDCKLKGLMRIYGGPCVVSEQGRAVAKGSKNRPSWGRKEMTSI